MKLPFIRFFDVAVVIAQFIHALDVGIVDLGVLSDRVVECSLTFLNCVHSLLGEWVASFDCESNSVKIVH